MPTEKGRYKGHFFISQHGFRSLLFSSILEIRKNICRSTWTGMVTSRIPDDLPAFMKAFFGLLQ
jgi:hypothetical protein